MKKPVDDDAAAEKREAEQQAIKRRLEAVNKILSILEALDDRDRSLVMKTVATFYGYNPDHY